MPGSPATREPKTRLIKAVLPVRMEDIINLSGHAADKGNPELTGIMLQFRTQGAANHGGDAMIPQDPQSLVSL
jgi:hypothetical protein